MAQTNKAAARSSRAAAPQTGPARRRVTFPVESLRAQVSALEAAIAQVLSRPKKDAVHGLRRSTRKIEAQLQVIAALARQEPGFNGVERPAERVSKLLSKLRKAAGKVRDLDVQRSLAKDLTASSATRKVRREARELRGDLKAEREHEAGKLVEVLEQYALKLEPRLERLMQKLESVAQVGMSAVELEVLTRAWYADRSAEAQLQPKPTERMHAVRKAAKLARYMVEEGAAARVVEEFESMQDRGGKWHDLLTLRDVARRRLGRQSGLARMLERRETAARDEFQSTLST